MRDFEVLFDNGEPGALNEEILHPYGKLGFPAPHADHPWTYSNFVQSLDGITSLLGRFGSGGNISESPEDRWLMDLLRAHADAIVMGINTLVQERYYMGNPRGPVFKVADPGMLELRQKLGRRRLKNIFVTNTANLQLSDFRVFDGEWVDASVVTTTAGAAKLRAQKHPHVTIVEAGGWPRVDLKLMARKFREELGIQYLLCEGGPTFYGSMSKTGLIDEKFVTTSPVEVGHSAPPEQEMAEFDKTRLRPTAFSGPGFTRETMTHWTWLSCRRVGDHEFNRYRKKVSEAV
jgi:5-amino-6-(5-phosphoribosylamino)uracil reductase